MGKWVLAMKGNRWSFSCKKQKLWLKLALTEERKCMTSHIRKREALGGRGVWMPWLSGSARPLVDHLRLSIRRPVFPCRQTLRAAGAGLRLPRQSQGEGPAPARDWEPFSALWRTVLPAGPKLWPDGVPAVCPEARLWSWALDPRAADPRLDWPTAPPAAGRWDYMGRG